MIYRSFPQKLPLKFSRPLIKQRLFNKIVLGKLYEVCYDAILIYLETAEPFVFVQLLKAHCYFIHSLTKELIKKRDSGEIEKEQSQKKIMRIQKMNYEFLEKGFIYISQNPEKLNWKDLSEIFEGLAVSGFKAGVYKDVIKDLALAFHADLCSLKVEKAVKQSRLEKFLGNLEKIGLPSVYKKFNKKES